MISDVLFSWDKRLPFQTGSLLSLIQQINHKIQIPGKGHPHQIWYLQVGGGSVEPAELKYHFDNAAPQDHKPYKCEQKRAHIKENNRPEEVENQLECIAEQGVKHVVRIRGFLLADARAADPHQEIEGRPHDREQDGKRRQGREA